MEIHGFVAPNYIYYRNLGEKAVLTSLEPHALCSVEKLKKVKRKELIFCSKQLMFPLASNTLGLGKVTGASVVIQTNSAITELPY